MLSYHYLLDIALILISTKFLGLFTRKLHMPQVVGALLAGIVLGPVGFNLLKETDFIKQVAELGVIILMFTAGLETDIVELKKAGKASLVIAIVGVLVPLAGGYLVAYLFPLGGESGANINETLRNVFIGIVLTATSVSITVETLKELGKLNTRAGNAILGAALIDDVLGIIALTVVSSFADKTISIFWVLGKILLFFVFISVVGFVSFKLFELWFKRYDNDLRRFVIVAFAFCLILSYVSERFFGVADITGAYFAGLIICNTQKTKYISNRFNTLSYMLLSPIFFASIGIEVVLPPMTSTVIFFSVSLLIIAILTKIIGCGFGAKICGYSNKESLQIGVGMVSRGEVALIVASKGSALGLMSSVYFGPTIIVVIFTTVITPILLKIVFNMKSAGKYEDLEESELIDRYEETEQLEMVSQRIADMNEQMKKDAKLANKTSKPEQ
ncbi:MAG: cation:proton antiporter [Oscillospiraceae bacterium]|nr:cation:proton antiporter [Oscillospiraceae bacterium]